jgi:hypothetical protein
LSSGWYASYDPGLNRFLSRDSYNGALVDLDLGLSPWTMNRYGFAGGNPVNLIELDAPADPRPPRRQGLGRGLQSNMVPLDAGSSCLVNMLAGWFGHAGRQCETHAKADVLQQAENAGVSGCDRPTLC